MRGGRVVLLVGAALLALNGIRSAESRVVVNGDWPYDAVAERVRANAVATLISANDHPLSTAWRRLVVFQTVLTITHRDQPCDGGSDEAIPSARDWLVEARDELVPGVPIGRLWLTCAATGYSRSRPD